MDVLCTWVKLKDLQILGCELHQNAFGGRAQHTFHEYFLVTGRHEMAPRVRKLLTTTRRAENNINLRAERQKLLLTLR